MTEAGTRIEGTKKVLSKIIDESSLEIKLKEKLKVQIEHANSTQLRDIVNNLIDDERKAITNGKNEKFLQALGSSSSTPSTVKTRFTSQGDSIIYKDGTNNVTFSRDNVSNIVSGNTPADMMKALQDGFSGITGELKQEDADNIKTKLENSTGRSFADWTLGQLEALRKRVKQ